MTPDTPPPGWYEVISPSADDSRSFSNCHYLAEKPTRRGRYYCIRCGSLFMRPHPDQLCRSCAAELPRRFQHEEAIAWARQMLASQFWCLLGFEVQGVGLLAEISQVAILSPKGEILLNSPVCLSHNDHCNLQPSFGELYPNLAELFVLKKVVAYNAAAHAFLLESACQQSNQPPLHGDWSCAMLWYARYYGEWNPYKKDFQWQPLGHDGSAVDMCRNMLALLHDMAHGRAPWLSQERRHK